MPYDAVELHSQHKAIALLREHRPPMLASAIDTFNAAMWVVAGGRLPQAVSLLHTSIELALKSELDRVHRALVAGLKNLDYDDLKRILRNEFASHPKGRDMEIPPFDFDKTITFTDSVTRVGDLYKNTVPRWKTRLVQLHELRNDIVHSGIRGEKSIGYVDAILCVAFPFLDSFLKDILPEGASLENLTTPRVYRELAIASNVADEKKKRKEVLDGDLLEVVASVVKFNGSHLQALVDNMGWIEDEGERDYELRQRVLRAFEQRGYRPDFDNGNFANDQSCRVCGESSLIVSLDVNELSDTPVVFVKAVVCYKCGLFLEGSTPASLVNVHFGAIPEDISRAFLRDTGYESKA